MKIVHVLNNPEIGGPQRLLIDLIPLQKNIFEQVAVVFVRKGSSCLEKRFHELGIEIVNLSALSCFQKLLHLRKFLKKFDLVHVHLFPAQYYVALALLGLRNRPKMVTTEHSTFNRRMALKWTRLFDRFIYSRYSKIIGVSTEVVTALKKHLKNHKSSSYSVIRNGLNFDLYRSALAISLKEIENKIGKKSKWILMAARFASAKDWLTLVDSAKILVERGRNIGVLCLGEGETKVSVQEHTKSIGMQDYVVIMPATEHLENYLKAVDAMVLSSFWEAMPMVLIEGTAADLPLVASNVVGNTQFIQESQNGLLFELGNAIDLADKLESVLYDESVRKSLMQKNYELLENKYSIKNSLREYTSVYSEA